MKKKHIVWAVFSVNLSLKTGGLEAEKAVVALYAVSVLVMASYKLSCWGASMSRIVGDIEIKKPKERTEDYKYIL